MHSSFFNVLHDAADDDVGAIGERVDVYFGGFFEELIDQHGARRAHQRGLRHVILHGVHVIRDDHSAAAENVAWPDQHWQSDLAGHACSLFRNQRRAVAGLRNFQFFQQTPKAPAIFRQVDRLWRGTDDGNTIALQFQREIERSLPAKLHDDALRLFAFHDGENVFESERLKVQTIRSVVVGRNRLWVAIDHDGLEAVFVERIGCVAAAIVEFNALPDAVRTAAQNHDFGALLRIRLILVFVTRIEIWREGLEFGGAGVDALKNRRNAVARALQANGSRSGAPYLRQLLVARAVALYFAKQFFGRSLYGDGSCAPFHGR